MLISLPSLLSYDGEVIILYQLFQGLFLAWLNSAQNWWLVRKYPNSELKHILLSYGDEVRKREACEMVLGVYYKAFGDLSKIFDKAIEEARR